MSSAIPSSGQQPTQPQTDQTDASLASLQERYDRLHEELHRMYDHFILLTENQDAKLKSLKIRVALLESSSLTTQYLVRSFFPLYSSFEMPGIGTSHALIFPLHVPPPPQSGEEQSPQQPAQQNPIRDLEVSASESKVTRNHASPEQPKISNKRQRLNQQQRKDEGKKRERLNNS